MNNKEKLGIKQVIRLEWMNRTLRLVLAGLPEAEIRKELDMFLADKKQSGGSGKRGQKTYPIAINMLSIWFTKRKELKDFNEHLVTIAARKTEKEWLPLHWALMSAAYPFWFNLAVQTGRLLALQQMITQKQIFDRIVEQYGERSTVLRNARYTVRSFNAWKVLSDTEIKGKYKRCQRLVIEDLDVVNALIEGVLFSNTGERYHSRSLLSSPGLFPFILPDCNPHDMTRQSERIAVESIGLNENYFVLR